MPRPNTNFESKKHELIEIAFELFMKKGYEDTTITDILKAANISKGAMYHYFDKKEDILDAVINYIIALDEKRYEPILKDTNISAIGKIVKMLKSSDSDVPKEIRVAREQLSKRSISIFDYRSRELSNKRTAEVLAKIIADGVASGELKTAYPKETAQLIIGSANTIHENAIENPTPENIKKQVDYFIWVLSTGLGIEPEQIEELKNLVVSQLK